MIKKLTTVVMLVDLLLAALALVIGNAMHSNTQDISNIAGPAGASMLAFVLLTVFSSYFCEIYRWEKALSWADLAARTAVAMTLAFFMLSAYFYLLPVAMIERGVLSYSLLVFGVLQLLAHLFFMEMVRLPVLSRRVLVLGVGSLAESIEKLLVTQAGSYFFVGFVRPEAEQSMVPLSDIIGNISEISDVIERERISHLVVALTEKRGVLPVKELLRNKLNGVNIVDAVTFYEEITRKLPVEDIQPSWFLYSTGFQITPFQYFIKRVVGIAISSCGILLLLPFLPVVGLLIRLDSPGPVFFRQIRVGERDKLFSIYKFRTMRQDAEKNCGAVWSPEDDPRITRVGKLLRKTRIDELPQLYNVLRGDMSLVGPRPERPEFVERLNEVIPYYSTRHFVKPGVTGWAQIWYPYGASDEDALEKLRYDLYYIKNYTLGLDFLIMLETVKVVLFGRGGR